MLNTIYFHNLTIPFASSSMSLLLRAERTNDAVPPSCVPFYFCAITASTLFILSVLPSMIIANYWLGGTLTVGLLVVLFT